MLKKLRDYNGNIIEYKILFPGTRIEQYKADVLKKLIIDGQMDILNLQLTSDGRLVDKKDKLRCKIHVDKNISLEQNVKNHIAKCKVLGVNVPKLTTSCDNPCYIIPLNDVLGVTQFIIYIPDNITELNAPLKRGFTVGLRKLIGMTKLCNLHIIGGHNLKDVSYMFCGCSINHLCLTELDTSKVENATAMFRGARTEMLIINNMNTSNINNMSEMFMEYSSNDVFLNLKSFDTSNVKDMSRMFKYCYVHSLELDNFNTENVKNMNEMFSGFSGNIINMQKANTKNVTMMDEIFENCEAFLATKDSKLNKAYEERYNYARSSMH